MGPHSFKCGSSIYEDDRNGRITGFNGAALFQVRKLNVVTITRVNINQLQWGRTLSSAEVNQAEIFTPIEIELQWGRTLSSAEVRLTAPFPIKFPRSFNGAALFQVRKYPNVDHQPKPPAMLQWGRTLSSAEVSAPTSARVFHSGSFNGAALFQVRKLAPSPLAISPPSRLQWGRTLSSAEVFSVISLIPFRAAGFNGAALFQVRK